MIDIDKLQKSAASLGLEIFFDDIVPEKITGGSIWTVHIIDGAKGGMICSPHLTLRQLEYAIHSHAHAAEHAIKATRAKAKICDAWIGDQRPSGRRCTAAEYLNCGVVFDESEKSLDFEDCPACHGSGITWKE